ncbi:hypothetical protein PhCBS80983_g02601 [Powellomyces hirtus]|uniref:FAD-binding domain-containing protein n=1 Tax=Powellomyces hirtus TaxID=109895 RepID=A0A507E836_9FUNG|nr:hypothetical protein PhCBS80983_g02601 [Powellomyces hirtus]
MMGETTSHNTPSAENEVRILIIGGGVAGLSAALSIKRVAAATGLNLRPIIFEADPTHSAFTTNMTQHWILWKWAYELLLEMGLGKRLSTIANPIQNTKTIDADTRETLVSYPPEEDPVAPNATEDPELGAARAAPGAPPMIGLRKADLVRMLLLALSGIRDDLLDSNEFVPFPPNPELTGIEADMAADNSWFASEGYAELVPDLVLGYELDSFMVSASTGKVTARFLNGAVEQGDMIIGADGTHSKVRDLIGNRRFPIQHAGAAVLHGITRIEDISEGAPEVTTADGTVIPPVLRDTILKLCPDSNAVSFVGRGVAFGVNNLGNGMLGWNLVVAQPEPHFHTSQFVNDQRAKAAVDADGAATPAGPSSTQGSTSTSYFQLEHVTSDGIVEGDISESPSRSHSPSPAASLASIDTLVDPVSSALSASSLTDSTAAPTPASPNTLSRSGTRRNRMETAFERQLRIQRQEILAAKSASNTEPSNQTTHLSGSRARDLALHLAARHPSLPASALGLIALADPNQTHAMDILDMADQYPETYTSPKFHPGRVVLIGDAAHPVATNATGSLGGSLAISDAALLAKLMGKHLASHHRRTSSPHTAISISDGKSAKPDLEARFKALSEAFDAARVPVCNAIMTDARAEGGWGRVETNWVRSLWRLSWRYTSRNWVRATYQQMLERGSVEKGLISLSKTNAGLV